MSTQYSSETTVTSNTSQRTARPQHAMRLLMLDDDGNRMATFCEMFRHHTLVMVNTAPMAMAMLEMLHFDVVFLDHDLGGEGVVSRARVGSGQDVAEALPGGRNARAAVVIHSWNPEGADAMKDELQRRGHRGPIRRIPFGGFSEDIITTIAQSPAESDATGVSPAWVECS